MTTMIDVDGTNLEVNDPNTEELGTRVEEKREETFVEKNGMKGKDSDVSVFSLVFICYHCSLKSHHGTKKRRVLEFSKRI